GRGVTVPISTNPKPSRSSASAACASLSNPAAMPIGFGKSNSHSRCRNSGESGVWLAPANPAARPARLSRCAVSGGNARKSGRTSGYRSGTRSGRDQFGRAETLDLDQGAIAGARKLDRHHAAGQYDHAALERCADGGQLVGKPSKSIQRISHNIAAFARADLAAVERQPGCHRGEVEPPPIG